MISLAAVFRIFEHSSLLTPRGKFEIDQVFKTAKDARKAKFRHYFTFQGTPIYTRRINKYERLFAIVSD